MYNKYPYILDLDMICFAIIGCFMAFKTEQKSKLTAWNLKYKLGNAELKNIHI